MRSSLVRRAAGVPASGRIRPRPSTDGCREIPRRADASYRRPG
ncbi:hypothetical protein [Microbacterium sp. 69-10]|nr:hypothetical protein [Microbacterium sp. 69-10]